MRVHEQPSELLGLAALIHLGIKEIRHRLVVKLRRDPGAGLLHELHVFDEQQIIAGGDPKAADLRVAGVTQKQELGPRRGAEPQHRRTP